MLFVKTLSENATLPVRATPGAAGYDLASAEYVNIPPRGHKLIKTDLAIAVPENTYGRIAPRSGLAYKYALDVLAGVIDADYRGNVGVILFNHSDQIFMVQKGDRIAQLILEKIETPEITQVENLPESVRGQGGFGSTGQ
jgi:dUTP pyrophosphatase